jgi:hypothetical protein
VAQVSTLRESIEKCYTYINQNGGFTVTGYITRGETPDVSNPNEKVVSERPTYHVSYTQPTNQAILNGYDMNNNALKFAIASPAMPTGHDQNTNDTATAAAANRGSNRTGPVAGIASHGNNQNARGARQSDPQNTPQIGTV